MDELSIGMMTSSAASRALNNDAQGSDETLTKMRINIKKALKHSARNDSGRAKTLEHMYEKNICKLENDLREKLSTNLKMQLYNDYLEEKVEKQKRKLRLLKEELEEKMKIAETNLLSLNNNFELQRENARTLVANLEQ
jgi:hypothetical protein